MKKIEIKDINTDKICRYLGYKNNIQLDDTIKSEIELSKKTALGCINPRAVYSIYNTHELEKIGFLEGNDIKKHLSGCEKVIVCAITVGNEIEEKIRAYGAVNALTPVILDACATAATEEAADIFCSEIKEEFLKKNLYITNRFSPGYGDFPIQKQHMLLKLVDSQRKIGLFVTETSILTPRKSITALIGISKKPTSGTLAGCDACALRERCEYRQKGEKCNV